MQYIFQAGSDKSAPTFLLLHGNGGTEKDFLPLTKKLNEHASCIAVRGEVVEWGERRFFKRTDNGQLDEADVSFRTNELVTFLNQAAETHGFDRANIVALGHLDGATMAASLLLHDRESLIGAILYHPIVPVRGNELPDLTGKKIFIGGSQNDPFTPRQEISELEEIFKEANADVHVHWERGRQYITGEEFAASRAWFENHFKK